MRNIEETGSPRLSRRALLIGGAALGAAPMLVSRPALAVVKVSQDCVHFSQSTTGDHRCGDCRLFRAPSSCLDVAGVISDHCSCRIWLPKVG
jgi:hypothetical protein